MNGPALSSFHGAVGRLWWRTLRRRSQKPLPWRRLRRYIQRWFPSVRICHPYPLQRLGVITQGGSRMRNVLKSKMWPSCFKPLVLNTLTLNLAT